MNVDLDGADISIRCLRKVWRPKLSRPASFTVRCPAAHVSCQAGITELHAYQGGSLIFSGLCAQPQASGDADAAYIEITAYDHLIHLKDRMVKTATGNLITPFTFAETAPGILAEYINNTRSFDPGPYRLSVGSVAGGGVDTWESLANFPMNLEQMRQLLVATGQLDVFVVPGVGSSVVNLTNGGGGNDLSGSVSFEYDTGAHNARVATVTVDTDQIRNAIWYLLAPRLSQTRWKGSITPTAPHKGGTWPPELLARIALSRALYGYKQEIQTRDQAGAYAIRPLFEAEWANEAWIRAEPRRFASVLPNRGTFPAFRPGDLISVSAGSILNGGFSGAQRVYEMTVEEDSDGVIEISEILASADQEGAP